MKKIVSLLVAIAILLSLSVPAAVSAENILTIAVDALENSVYPGDKEVKVFVRIPAEPVWSAVDLRFYFDPQILTFESFSLNPELKRQSEEGEMNIYILDKERISKGEIGIGFITVTKAGGYEGYYPAEYDYFGYFTFSVNEEAALGFSEISLEVCDVKTVLGDIAIDVPFEAKNGGVIVECPHEWEMLERKEPTCEEEGFESSRCLLCGEEKTETIAAVGHEWDDGIVTPPTCTEDGFISYTCLNDPTHTKTEKGDALLGHSWEEVEIVAPTCEEGGYTSYVCRNDPEHTKRENEVAPLEHDFGEWEETKAPTCGGNGEEKRVCKRDPNHVETREISALEHEWNEGVMTPPTCTEDGYTTYTCLKDATHTKVEKGEPAFGHDFGEWQKLAETTCEKNGKLYRECKNDPSHYEIETIPAFGHSYVENGRQAPTCTDEGWIDYVCENDPSHTHRETVSALGHTKENGNVTVAATCCSVGEIAYNCPVCGADFTEEIPIDPEAHEWDELWETKREPTCSVSGIEACHCVLNGEHINERLIAPLGHIWGEGVELKAPTCSTEGVVTYTCLRDESHTIVENIAPVDDAHSYVATVVPPTCVDEGYTEHVCEYNSEHRYKSDPVPANGHSWKAWQIVGFPTCETGGSLIRYCSVCDESEVADLAPLGHDFGEWEQTKAPTPLECGEEKRVCKHDADHFELREIPKLDNMPGDMDSDMVITVSDALALLRIAAGMNVASELELAIGDMDSDGIITVSDALAVLRIAAGFSE